MLTQIQCHQLRSSFFLRTNLDDVEMELLMPLPFEKWRRGTNVTPFSPSVHQQFVPAHLKEKCLTEFIFCKYNVYVSYETINSFRNWASHQFYVIAHILHVVVSSETTIPFKIGSDTSNFTRVMALLHSNFCKEEVTTHLKETLQLISFLFCMKMCLTKLQIPYEIGLVTSNFNSYDPILTEFLI